MDKAIVAICRQIQEEAGAIHKYTEDIGMIGESNPDTLALLQDIRLDELEHIQKLTLELTKLLMGDGSDEEDEGEAE